MNLTDYAVLRDDLARVLNRHSAENRSNTPDHLLAEFVLDALEAFDRVTRMRETWYGRGIDETILDPGGIRDLDTPTIPNWADDLPPEREIYDIGPADRTPTTVFDWPDDTPLGEALGQAIGYASTLWTEGSRGIFESEKAADLVNELLHFITRHDTLDVVAAPPTPSDVQ